jgi:hypothetical protein
MSHRTRMLSIGTSFAALLAVPASAAAVTATVNQPCYTHIPTRGSQPVVVSLTGGTPGANFLVSATVPGKGTGSAGSVNGTFDAAGNGSAEITDVSPPSGTIDATRGQRIDLSVADFGAGGVDVPVGSTLVTNLAMTVSSKPISPRARRLVRVSGAPFAGQHVYGFVTKPHGNRVLRRVSLGKGDVCGYTQAKAVVAPADFKVGTYRFYINAGKKLNTHTAIYESFQIFRRVF